MFRLVAAFGLTLGFAQACECVDIGTRKAKAGSEVTFRGTVRELRVSADGYPLVVFLVSRVWKGTVTERFEMRFVESDSCLGFRAGIFQLGSDMLVYAYESHAVPDHPAYMDVGCTTKGAIYATDIGKLGAGRKPKAK
jgi:hypothetical protein